MTSSSERRMKFQVFLSFKDSDVRNNFVGHLYAALDHAGIFTYVDRDEELFREGVQINPTVMKALEDSHLAIVIFSERYTSSAWCLEELATIMKCKEQKDLMVFPVFYKVEPREVRGQTPGYREAMAEHKDYEKVKQWKKALDEASRLAGWLLDNGSEATLIENIVKDISELKRFDVFLSFRDEDDRENFINRLNKDLEQRGIKTFIDSKNLVMGPHFPLALKDAIQQSRMYVVVFSENYAKSWRCLKELEQIIERKNQRKQPMLPIFYQVKPSEVRSPDLSYRDALEKHKIEYGERKVKKWKEVLSEAANVSGMDLTDRNGDDWIPGIVKEIEKMMAEIE